MVYEHDGEFPSCASLASPPLKGPRRHISERNRIECTRAFKVYFRLSRNEQAERIQEGMLEKHRATSRSRHASDGQARSGIGLRVEVRNRLKKARNRHTLAVHSAAPALRRRAKAWPGRPPGDGCMATLGAADSELCDICGHAAPATRTNR
jgi:hypothetical protein